MDCSCELIYNLSEANKTLSEQMNNMKDKLLVLEKHLSSKLFHEIIDSFKKILVVCSSPTRLKGTFLEQLPDIVKYIGTQNLFIFLKSDQQFPMDITVDDHSLDVIWFCGCNIITDILKENWKITLKEKLKANGKVIFTESRKFNRVVCHEYYIPEGGNGIYVDITCYGKPARLQLRGLPDITKQVIHEFLEMFIQEQNGKFIYYIKGEEGEGAEEKEGGWREEGEGGWREEGEGGFLWKYQLDPTRS